MGSLPHKCAARSGGGLGVKTPIQRKYILLAKIQISKSEEYIYLLGLFLRDFSDVLEEKRRA
jgi:hypothetical protein